MSSVPLALIEATQVERKSVEVLSLPRPVSGSLGSIRQAGLGPHPVMLFLGTETKAERVNEQLAQVRSVLAQSAAEADARLRVPASSPRSYPSLAPDFEPEALAVGHARCDF